MIRELVYSGKVRDVFDAGDGLLLMVASDRISAFDDVFDKPIPDKGRVLTAMTAYWGGELAEIAPTHLVSTDPADFPVAERDRAGLAGRAMLVRRAEMLPIECIVRGYLAGSAWREYRERQTMHGEPLPAGLVEADRLPEPVFTPSTKAATGHDENIAFAAAAALVGEELAGRARAVCLAAYSAAARAALARGVIVADTKFELGIGRRRPCDLRRDRDAGLVAPVGRGDLGRRPHAALVRQAAAARLAGGDGLGHGATTPVDAGRGRRLDAGALRRGLRADHRAAPGRLVGRRRENVSYDIVVEIRGLAGLADPEGLAIERALPSLGFDGVRGVHVGKVFRFDVDAPSEAELVRPPRSCATGCLPTR